MNTASADPRKEARAEDPSILGPGSIVLLYLTNPSEKYWGLLQSLDAAGVILRGLHLSSFEEWLSGMVREEDPFLSPSTTFFPLLRVERVALDEPAPGVESLQQRFHRLVGTDVRDFL